MSKFRLESVLRVRRTRRDEAEVRAAEASRAITAAARRVEQRLSELEAATVSSANTGAFLVSVTAQSQRADAVRAAELAVIEAREAHRARLAELVRASMAVSALEKLEERAIEAALADERSAEVREIDDLVTSRHSVSRAGR
jgi:flagellar export protein FliJ